MKTHTRSFDIYLPGSKDTPPRLVETIEVEVYEKFGEEILTAESRELIERITAQHMGVMTGGEIRQLRTRLGYTQAAFSKLFQCGEKSLTRWESGRCNPSGIVNLLLRLLDEGFLAPASLEAVQGPRRPCDRPRVQASSVRAASRRGPGSDSSSPSEPVALNFRFKNGASLSRRHRFRLRGKNQVERWGKCAVGA